MSHAQTRTGSTNLVMAIEALRTSMMSAEGTDLRPVVNKLDEVVSYANAQSVRTQASNTKLDALLAALTAISTKLDTVVTAIDKVTTAVNAGTTKHSADTLLITGKIDSVMAKPFWVVKSAGTITLSV
jgi:hypothetical protein